MAEEFPDFLFQGWKRDREGRPARIDHNRPRRSQFPEVQAYRFTEAALDPVSKDGSSERTWGSEADTWGIGARLRQIERGKMSAGIALAGIINCSELTGP